MAADGSTTPAIHEHPAVDRQRLRQKCERAVDKLLMILDAIEDDPDLEPSLGFLEPSRIYSHGGLDQSDIADGGTDDREEDRSDHEHNLGWESPGAQLRLDAGTDDVEAALGWPEQIDQSRYRRSRTDHEDEPTMGSSWHTDQTGWALGYDRNDSEREVVCEDEGADVDATGGEPSLGSVGHIDQRHWGDHEDPKVWGVLDGEDEHDGREEEEDAEHDGAEPDEGDHSVMYLHQHYPERAS